ncbi:Cytochrome c/b562 domain-containing protein [Dioscorea alata]|uniref:Cytochrome c/b562 domain-containing protein n=1 Tax=Dioscorea alata TaxID=55571 RepID=A0ACB7UL11_DIOAL|nr:Cytochrome c/b562 domain-containing protein [Dioscorea alata]
MQNPIESEGEDNEVQVVSKDESKIWSTEREKILIELMEEEVKKGNRPTTTFTKEAWKTIRSELSKNAKFNYTENQVRNKFNQLRSRHTNFGKLLKETSVGYVATIGQLIASEEIWQRLYGVNKMAKKFRKYGCPLYDKLCVIYGDTTATGSNARPSTQSPSDSEENVRDPLLQEEDKIQTLSDEDDIFGDIPNTSQDVTSEAISESKSSRRNFLKESLEALDALDGIDGAAYAKAIEKFHDDELWREIFLQLPNNRKKDWVLNLE